MPTHQIEPRLSTAEPLVEAAMTADKLPAAFVPAGRRERAAPPVDSENNALRYSDGLNSFALDSDHATAYNAGVARLDAIKFGNTPPRPSDYRLAAEDAALAAAGIATPATATAPATFDVEKADAFLVAYRVEHPWPTSFPALPFGDPANNLEEIPDAPAAVVDTAAPTVTVHAEPIAPDHEPVVVPADVVLALPVATVVSQSPDGVLVAAVPIENGAQETEWHHVRTWVGAEFSHLAAAVKHALHLG